jgi:hypothetical protein
MFAEHDRGCESLPNILTLSLLTLPDVRRRCPRYPVRARGAGYHMSQFAEELYEYCADIAPIVPSLPGVP